MAAHQSKIAIADGGPIMTTARRPPMTSKQAKKAFAKANNVPKMNWKERKRMEAAELAAQKREFEKEKAQAKARALKAKKDAKEEAEKAERKKNGIPEKSRWVRPSQGRITGFLGLGKRGRDKSVGEEEDESADDAEEPVPKRVAVDGAEDDTEEEDIEERESYAPEAPAIKTLCDTKDEEQDAQPEDRPRHVEGDLVARKEKDNSPETQPEEGVHDIPELEVEVEPELVVQSEPEVQPEVEARPQPEVQLDQGDRLEPNVHAKPEVESEPAAQERPEIHAGPDVHAEPVANEEPGAQAKSEGYSASNPHDPKLPANSQYFTSSQDFLDDDDIFLELAAAHQLLSESFDAGERSQAAAAQSSPVLATKEALVCAKANASQTVAHSPQHHPHPTTPAKPTSLIPSQPKQQSDSPVLQRTPRPRMEFECSGISPELTSSNPFSQKQAALRSASETISRPNAAAVSPVMGPPASIIRPRTAVPTPIRSQSKNMPPPNMIKPPSHRATRGVVVDGSTCRPPLNDISRQAQNTPFKAQPSSSCSKPFLKPSLPLAHAAPKVSPFAPPTSTQLFLADHLDDFFPSPSQELRELLEDIEDDDIPSNTQVAREIGRECVVARPALVEPAQPILDDDFPWASSQNFVFSSQELRELESPIKASPVPAPPPTPWDVRRARKPRFFVEKEEDLFAAAIHESKLQGKVDDEAIKLRLENMRIERELLGTRQSWQRLTPSVKQTSQDAVRIEADANDISEQLEGLNASQLTKLMEEIESDEYGDDFDDDDAEASMIAFVDKLENPIACVL
ncbi:hypothetical protein V490_01143 [Pseudogymnoascus sp. VKM F-3557]|nr:hypothetical protein V490_01143 [Pseudogymnoascus sp. VKM F-3557]